MLNGHKTLRRQQASNPQIVLLRVRIKFVFKVVDIDNILQIKQTFSLDLWIFVVSRLYPAGTPKGNSGKHKERKTGNRNSHFFFPFPLTGIRLKSINCIVFVLCFDLQLKISGAFHWGEKQIHKHTGIAPAGEKCFHL